MKRRVSLVPAIVVLGTTLSIQQGHAQDAGGLEEIVVTARKVSEDIQTVPVSITALSSEAIREQNIQAIGDLQAQIPNLIVQSHSSDPQGLSFAIRGQKQNDVLLTVDPSVGLYIDGVYYPRTLGLRGALADLERIEVLRGPQGTLYGKNTTGGAISIFTKDPTDEFGASVEVDGGNFSAIRGTGIFNVPLSESVALRLVAQRAKRDGYGEDNLGRDLADEDSEYVRAKLKGKFGDNVEVTLWGSYQTNETGGSVLRMSYVPATALSVVSAAAETGTTPPQALALLQSYQDDSDFYDSNSSALQYSSIRRVDAGLDITAELSSALTFRSITGYQTLTRSNQDDFDATPLNIGLAVRETEDDFVSQELQLLGTSDQFNWVAGLYGAYEDGTEVTFATVLPFFAPAAAGNPSVTDGDVTTTSFAAFAQGTWEFAPQWRGTLGARWSQDKREVELRNRVSPIGLCVIPAANVYAVSGGPTDPSRDCPRSLDKTFSKPSWLASVDYQATDDIMAYGKVAFGYRSGGFNLRGTGNQDAIAPFDPEEILEYEVGFKAELMDRVRVNLAVFYDDYKDIQRTVTVQPTVGSSPVTVVTNAAKAEIFGLELETTWQVTDQFAMNASAALTDAENKEFEEALSGGGTRDRSGEPFDVPEWTASFGLNFTQPLPTGDLNMRADYRWQDDVNLVPAALTPSTVTQDSYGLLGARVSLQLDEWDTEIALYGRNLTDEEYYAAGVSLETSVLGWNYLVAGEPRTYGVQLTKRFGDGL